VLAGLLRHDAAHSAGIAQVLPAQAFSSPHRQAVYQVLTVMHQAGKAVDALTVDWELASRGVPLDARPRPGAALDDLTYTMRLARLNQGQGESVATARELAVDYWRSRSARPAGNARHEGAGGQHPAQALGPGNAQARGIPGRRGLRLIQPPPQANGPARPDPQQAR
jgi:hypothetical protein